MWPKICLAAALVYILAFIGPAHSYTTAEDVVSGRYADDGQNFLDQPTDTHINVTTGENATYPRDSVTTCTDTTCVNRSLRPDPTDCPAGQVLVIMRKYGNKSAVCVKE